MAGRHARRRSSLERKGSEIDLASRKDNQDRQADMLLYCRSRGIR